MHRPKIIIIALCVSSVIVVLNLARCNSSIRRFEDLRKWSPFSTTVDKQDVTFVNEQLGGHIVIIGSGPTALGAAQRLFEYRGIMGAKKVTILEQESHPGGLASSERDEKGFLWDMGGHVVFSHYEYFDKTLDRAVKDWNKRKRAAFAFMKGSDGERRFISYPVQNNIEVMDKVDQGKSLAGLEEITNHPIVKKPANFDEWLVKNFGVGLCDVFMRKYNKKVWTVNSTEMNSVWVGERVAVPDIEKIKQKIEDFNEGKTVQEQAWGPNSFFRFPSFNGTGNIWRGVANLIPRNWFKFQTRVTAVDLDLKTMSVQDTRSKTMSSMTYDTLISTVPLDNLFGILKCNDRTLKEKQVLASQLVYSHTHVIGVGLKGQPPKSLSDKSWMYFPDSDSPFYRITVFSNYSDDHVPKPRVFWSLMCEAAEPQLPSNPGYWEAAKLVTATVDALVDYGFISKEQVVSKYHRRLEHGYPVPSVKRDHILNVLQPWLESKDVYSRGRFGGWRYEVSNQDHSFMQGVEVADRIVKGVPEATYPTPNLVNSRRNVDRRFIDGTV
ncbi:uncharacterized protein [Asterias amurensis]|uniref:uncharacterized protein n=1 Tax=Asterias amurensis TaxID=7602 RepID=UPI003AB384FA